ncbi:hypothetical protein SAMN05660209_03536 [Geodermatophilus africanus]|uniref:DUF1648 domain-containing protein n=1 Tax=Geodermatophilus africanus TaxID=1137993 RepID=A0A1H3M382_9ACTN|nr:hypothetical protein SAMN05660209_03536 [Geodermatophilus africanus]
MQRSVRVVPWSPLLATGSVALAALAWRDRFPAGVASHVGPDGVVDAVASVGAFAAAALAVGAGLTLLWGLLARDVRRNPAGLRLVATAATGSAALLAAGAGALLATSLDRGTLLGEPAPRWLLPLVLVALGGGSLLGWALARGPAPAEARQSPPPDAPRVELPEGTRAVWTRVVVAPPVLAGAVVLAGLGVALAVVAGPTAGVPALVVAAALAPTASVRVTVDHTGVSARPTLLPRPRVHVPLTRVVRAGRSDVRARKLGGWGLRVRGERTAVLLRSGEALDLELADGSRFLVTVDDAATAAALVNTLAERSRVC